MADISYMMAELKIKLAKSKNQNQPEKEPNQTKKRIEPKTDQRHFKISKK